MHPSIQFSQETPRGCGYRKTGGLYFVSNAPGYPCGRLPFPLVSCPCCGHGIKPARGWTWIDADKFIDAAPPCEGENCTLCPLGRILDTNLGRAGLLWVGEEHYPTVKDFQIEANSRGISRRISAVPNDFELGKTWILLAHRKAILKPVEFGKPPEWTPGVFRIFRPERIEIIVDGSESDAVIEGYLKRGLTPVLVQPIKAEKPINIPIFSEN